MKWFEDSDYDLLAFSSELIARDIVKVAWASRCVCKEEPRALVRANQDG